MVLGRWPQTTSEFHGRKENFLLLAKSGIVDASQEMVALGAANLFGSFFQSMPVSASFGRTAVNAASGIRTTMGGLVGP